MSDQKRVNIGASLECAICHRRKRPEGRQAEHIIVKKEPVIL